MKNTANAQAMRRRNLFILNSPKGWPILLRWVPNGAFTK
jgi:hypothetical protein